MPIPTVQFFEQKITFVNKGRGSTGVPENVGCETVPFGVKVCVCVAKAEPVKVSAGTVPAVPVKVSAGTVCV